MTMQTDVAEGRNQKWRARRAFLGQFIEQPFMIGAVAPSSRQLCEEIVRGVDLKNARAVVEFGPGSGVATDLILPRLGPQTKFLAIELNERLVGAFRARHPRVTIVHDSVENVRGICTAHGIEQADVIVSGLPWASFNDGLQDRILSAAFDVLKPGGVLVTFGYHVGTWLKAGKRFYGKLPSVFAKVEKSPTVWRNLPPAFVVRCTKG